MRTLSESTRETILQETAKLLSGREFASLTTREIAAAAGISEATIFRYFRKKDDILEAIVTVKGEQLFQEIEESLRLVDSPHQKLLAVLRQYARFACRLRGLVIVCQREYSLSKKSRPPDALKHWLETLQGLLREGMRQGVFRKDLEVRTTAMAFHSVPHTLFLQELIFYPKPMSEKAFLVAAEAHYQLLLRAIRIENESV